MTRDSRRTSPAPVSPTGSVHTTGAIEPGPGAAPAAGTARPLAWHGMAAVCVVCLAASLPYLQTLHNYFVQDDFGVVQLLARKPASSFFRWFSTTWMDDIWGYIPDEIRPFPAVSYQLTALWGAASPVANHVVNIALHAANGLLVLALARRVVGLSLVSATFTALVFVLLPMQAESVAWITGRVDTLPTFFYVASFVMYARWRLDAGPRYVSLSYASALVLFFVALFCKQNTITLAPALVMYDLLIERRPVRLSWAWMRPYVPFVLLTLGYLGLRFIVFGEVAREGQLTAQGLAFFGQAVERHLRRMVFGAVAGGSPLQWTAMLTAVVAVWLAARRAAALPPRGGRERCRHAQDVVTAPFAREVDAKRLLGSAMYFGPVWLCLGIAPIVVAGYESPRHIYLASIGWAVLLGLAFHVLWHARPRRAWRVAATIAAIAVLAGYTGQLRRVVAQWTLASTISRQAVADLEREALAAPEGSLVIAGAPISSWEWALPYAARPPFTQTDVSTRVRLVSPMRLHCCRSPWHEYTRRTLQTWLAQTQPAQALPAQTLPAQTLPTQTVPARTVPARTAPTQAAPVEARPAPSASAHAGRPWLIALHWDPRTGALSRVTDREEPFLRAMIPILLESSTPDILDARIQELLTRAVAGRRGP